jgi:hypothetical protein
VKFHLGDHPTREPYDWIGVQANNPDILRDWCDQRGLYCPNCEYLLRGVEGAGLAACPECGHPIEFDELRMRRLYGYDLGAARDVIKGVLLRPTTYLRQFKGPQHYLRVAPEHGCFAKSVAVAVLGAMVLIGLAASFTSDAFFGFFFCPLLVGVFIVFALHYGSYGWFRVVLALAGREATDRGAARIMYFASVAYVPMVAPVWMLALAAAIAGSDLPQEIRPDTLATLVACAALALGLAMAVGWGYVAMVVFNNETYDGSPMLAVLALANPVTVVVGGGCAVTLALIVTGMMS